MGNGILIIAAPGIGERLAGALRSQGHEPIQVFTSAGHGLRIANENGAELAVVTHVLPDMPGLQLAAELEPICPVILLSTPQQSEWAGALGRHVIQLTTPIKTMPFLDAVGLCLQRASQPLGTAAAKQTVTPQRLRSGEEKALIESAKQRLMSMHNIDEPAAHRQLQRLSMDSGKPAVEVARIVLEVL